MEIDRTGPDDTAPRQRNRRATQAAKQRSHDADGPAHLADQIVISEILNLGCLHRHGIAFELYLRAKGLKDLSHELDVAEIGHAADYAFFRCEQRRSHNG